MVKIGLNILGVTFSLLTFYYIFASGGIESIVKQRMWDQMAKSDVWEKELAHVKSPVLKETIMALNFLDIEIYNFGDKDYPWITVFEKSPEFEKIQDQFMESEDENLMYALREIQQTQVEPLYKLLEKFYSQRQTPYDRTLIIDYDQLLSVGALMQNSRTEEEKIAKMQEYENEMQAFAQFLKETFLKSK